MRGRLFWLVAGATAGYVVLRRLGAVRKPSMSGTVNGVGRRVIGDASAGAGRRAQGAIESAREFLAEVRVHASEREDLLRAALSGDADADEVAAAREVLERPGPASGPAGRAARY